MVIFTEIVAIIQIICYSVTLDKWTNANTGCGPFSDRTVTDVGIDYTVNLVILLFKLLLFGSVKQNNSNIWFWFREPAAYCSIYSIEGGEG